MWKTGTPAGTGVQPRMPNVKTAIKLDIFTRYVRPRKELNREPILFKPPRMMTAPTLMKMESRQPNPPKVNMLRLVNHIEANKGGKHLKFPIASHPKGP